MILGRMVGWLCLGIAAFSLGWDIATWLDTGAFAWGALGEQWNRLHPESLLGFQVRIERNVAPWLWDPVIQTVLLWPGWLTFGVLGLVLIRLF